MHQERHFTRSEVLTILYDLGFVPGRREFIEQTEWILGQSLIFQLANFRNSALFKFRLTRSPFFVPQLVFTKFCKEIEIGVAVPLLLLLPDACCLAFLPFCHSLWPNLGIDVTAALSGPFLPPFRPSCPRIAIFRSTASPWPPSALGTAVDRMIRLYHRKFWPRFSPYRFPSLQIESTTWYHDGILCSNKVSDWWIRCQYISSDW